MARKKRKTPGINGSSSADIAFMLLLFFLLTTSMDTDRGLPRRLPPPPDNKNKPEEQKVNKRNTLSVLVSSDNRIMCNMEEVSTEVLNEKAKEFIENANDDVNLPEKEEIDIPLLGGKIMSTAGKHVISLQCDRGTEYQKYLDVQNELAKAYNELRDIKSEAVFRKKYAELTEEEAEAIRKFYPQKISEAEPKVYGATKK
ncbi:MAG: biopolymer transporter ExbD [Tannerella sp.]|jgi:biopolymer transport protein ExbD|nr:biopolymer transporter ExbD [Tannerella sp.]